MLDERSLLVFIWKLSSSGEAFDGSIRWGISDAAPDRRSRSDGPSASRLASGR